MNKLREIQYLVKYQLIHNKETRNDDSVLYSKVCDMLDAGIGDMPFAFVLENRAELGIPCFESVRRTRQKLQAENTDLRPTKAVAAMRSEAEEEFKAYALS